MCASRITREQIGYYADRVASNNPLYIAYQNGAFECILLVLRRVPDDHRIIIKEFGRI